MKMIWEKVIVDWCEEWKCWTVGTYDNEGNRKHFSEHHRREWAIDDAKILAFEDQVGPHIAKVNHVIFGSWQIRTAQITARDFW